MYNNRHFAHRVSAGVDKLTITSNDFSVKNIKMIDGLKLKPCLVELSKDNRPEQVLLIDKAGNRISGQSAFLNTGLLNININQYGLQVILNPSKPYHSFEICSDQAELNKRIRQSIMSLKDKGISADWRNCRISRIDLAQNAIMEKPCNAYAPIFKWLQIPYSKRKAIYQDGFSCGNNAFCLSIYNKGKLMRIEKNMDIIHDHLMRIEIQFKSKRSVNKKLQINTLGSLLDQGLPELQETYKNILSNDIFKFKTDQQGLPKFSYDEELELLISLKARFPKQSLVKYLQIKGVSQLFEHVGSVELFQELISKAGFHRNTVRQQIKRMNKLASWSDYKVHRPGLADLYSELLGKFAA